MWHLWTGKTPSPPTAQIITAEGGTPNFDFGRASAGFRRFRRHPAVGFDVALLVISRVNRREYTSPRRMIHTHTHTHTHTCRNKLLARRAVCATRTTYLTSQRAHNIAFLAWKRDTGDHVLWQSSAQRRVSNRRWKCRASRYLFKCRVIGSLRFGPRRETWRYPYKGNDKSVITFACNDTEVKYTQRYTRLVWKIKSLACYGRTIERILLELQDS